MFDPGDQPHIFGMPPGGDFAQTLVDGLITRQKGQSPEACARAEIYVNTSRMRRRIRAVFDAGPPRLLPRVRLITDLAMDPSTTRLPPPVSALRRRLEISQFVAKLLDQTPDLAPRAALYDLSDSLAALMDEMQGEGVTPATIAALDVTDQSGHWDRALQFLNIITPFFGENADAPDQEARQRMVIIALSAHWTASPPQHPIIVAGSTGSRGATALFMQAVAQLPQGAIVLPGFDFDLPQSVWDSMDDQMTTADHPQYRFRKLMDRIGFTLEDVAEWAKVPSPNSTRNKLISLSLRPAPVTDQWLQDGPKLGDLTAATDGLTLVEAASPRAEAETIALRLRQAAEDGITAALISPDRMLTRQVTAALDRWNIKPDDSAGVPLPLSPPGRMLRHVADIFGKPLTGEALLILLKHPLCHSGRDDRGDHLLRTRELELHLRRRGPPFPTRETLVGWAAKTPDDAGRMTWAHWLAELCAGHETTQDLPLGDHLAKLLALTCALCAGPDADGAGGLWDETAGREARRICNLLIRDADAGGTMETRDFVTLFGSVLATGVVRDRDAGHPGILIWGTLEARVQSADLIILGGMNEGVWPEAPTPDPWLNRAMRAEAGLLLPERRIGLSAHDYQQAIAGREVWITRSKRSADAETVPSRWVNRLMNLLSGLPDQGGAAALERMQARGTYWSNMAARMGEPTAVIPPADRPSPCPPVIARPDKISVTQIKTLIRDPYAIYARKVLRLDPLDPLVPEADAPLRGIIVHEILQQFIARGYGPSDRTALMQIAQEMFDRDCPWPTIRAQWIARTDRVADAFLAGEADRQAKADRHLTEISGAIIVPETIVTLTCKADRIDVTPDQSALIYDYKTGIIPTGPQQISFDKQLLLEAAMVERGAFEVLGSKPVDAACFVAVNATMRDGPAPLDTEPADVVWSKLQALLIQWGQQSQGYTARRALFSKTDASPYDGLSRFGEWDTSAVAVAEVLK